MENVATYSRSALLQVADLVARDKGIDRDEVLVAMEQAIQKAGRSKYGQEYDIRSEIDRKSGQIRLLRFREVAEPIENEATQIALAEARRFNPDAEIGDFITDPLPPIDFGRIAAQTAKQVIVQKVRDAERARQFKEFKDRVGEIVNGLAKRVEFGNVIVDLGRAEAILRRDELLPRESFRQGERVRAYIYDVRQEARGPQIFLSRTHPQFMAKLFAQEVPEIYDGIIEIRDVARRRGQNVRLASQLTGWDIDILTEAEESERRTEEFRTRSQLFIEALDIDDVIAHLLVTEGFTSVEEVAFVPLQDLAGIEGFDEDVAGELQERAKVFIERKNQELEARRLELGVS